MQPTADPRTASLSHDLQTFIADHARSRQRWLILLSLGLNHTSHERHSIQSMAGTCDGTVVRSDRTYLRPLYRRTRRWSFFASERQVSVHRLVEMRLSAIPAFS